MVFCLHVRATVRANLQLGTDSVLRLLKVLQHSFGQALARPEPIFLAERSTQELCLKRRESIEN